MSPVRLRRTLQLKLQRIMLAVGGVTRQLYDSLTAIQTGTAADSFGCTKFVP